MIVHLVLGKPREDLSAEETAELEAAIASLGEVRSVMDMTWGPDFSGRGKGYAYAAVLRFADRGALQEYQDDALHKQVVETFNRLMPERLIVDYEVGTGAGGAAN